MLERIPHTTERPVGQSVGGAIDEAVGLAERAYDEGDPWLPWSGSNPPGMRFEDPRLLAILKRTGLL